MSLLDLIRIAEPCSESWAGMTGERDGLDDRRRTCAKCDKTVHDLSQLTRAEVEVLVATGRNLCGRYFQRHDGAVVLADCLVRRKRIATAGALAAAALVGGVLAHDPGPEAVTLDDVVLPESEASPIRTANEHAPAIDEAYEREQAQAQLEALREELRNGNFKAHGEFLGGALTSTADYSSAFSDLPRAITTEAANR